MNRPTTAGISVTTTTTASDARTTMKYKVSSFTIHEFGKRKDEQGNPHQEDSIFSSDISASPDDHLYILCDGMGGHERGEVASSTVCEAMSATILADPDHNNNFSKELLSRAIDAAFEALDRRDNTDTVKKMGTTMTMVKLHDRGATIAHMGDSRVYHIRPGRTADETEILHVTRDHSLVAELVRLGEMTPEDALTSNRRNVITRAMQPHMAERPHAEVTNITDVRPGDCFLLCSDGMLEKRDMENGAELHRVFSGELKDDKERRRELQKLTSDNSDNHSAIAVHIDEIDGRVAEMPVISRQQRSLKPILWIIAAIAAVAALWLGISRYTSGNDVAADEMPGKITRH